jgi:hypothetical protein
MPTQTKSSDPTQITGATETVQTDDSGLSPLYANFCRVTGTPEEIVLDFGLSTSPLGRSTGPIKMCQRLVCNYYTAKRLLMALAVSVQRYEKAFGLIEVDISKRAHTDGTAAEAGKRVVA